jgi:hypothetical protein
MSLPKMKKKPLKNVLQGANPYGSRASMTLSSFDMEQSRLQGWLRCSLT